jgi:uncharacterized phage-like protein YoqJ
MPIYYGGGIYMCVCFTGHRPDRLGGYDENNPIAINVKVQLMNNIADAYNKGHRKFITGMALGADMWAAEILIDMKEKRNRNDIRIVAAIPFKGQETAWPLESQKRYHKILEKVDQIVYICEPGYHPHKMQRRNIWMVDNSDKVIAVWNGIKGGTANCIEYAKRVRKPVIYIDPTPQ